MMTHSLVKKFGRSSGILLFLLNIGMIGNCSNDENHPFLTGDAQVTVVLRFRRILAYFFPLAILFSK